MAGHHHDHDTVAPQVPEVTISDPRAFNNLLKVRVQRNHVWALIDSGANISVISTELAALLSPCIEAHYTPDFSHVSGVGGEMLQVTDRVVLGLYIGDQEFIHEFHVVSIRTSMILGLDFLNKFKAVVNFATNTLTLDDIEVSLSSPTIRSCLARTVTALDIPPKSEAIIPVKCSRKYLNCDLLLEPTNNDNLTAKVTHTLTNVSGDQTVVRVLNSTHEHVSIPAHTVIAYGRKISLADVQAVEIPHTDESGKRHTGPTDQDLDFHINNPNISDSDRQTLQKFLSDNRNVFACSKADLGRSSLVQHEIDTGDAKPVSMRFYRSSPMKRNEIDTQVEELLQLGLIRPSTSEWSSPVVLVKKPDGSWRLCCDFRKVNSVTRPQAYPLPRLEDVWDAIGECGAQVFSTLDMSNGFWQFAMHPDSIHKTSFVTQNGQYEWNVLPYGLRNSPVTFMRTVHQALRGLVFKCCVLYSDDIICYSANMADHLEHLSLIFQRLKEAQLKLNPRKCHFAATEVKYLGHLLSAQGVKPNPEKTAVVDTFPTPKNAKEVRSFLGLTNYYRRFILNYSKLAAPLYNLLHQDVRFEWTEDCQRAFTDLKTRLVNHPIIGYPDMNRHFYLTTDASKTGLGYVLTQSDDDNKEVVIAYGGRALRDAETRYSATELEMLAAKEGITTYRPYLEDKSFTLVTDHQPLKAVHKFKAANKRLGEMALFLQGYTFDVKYKTGKSNSNADTLSRRPYDSMGDKSENVIEEGADSTTSVAVTVGGISYQDLLGDAIDCQISSIEPCDMAALQRQCPDIGDLYVFHFDGTLPVDPERSNSLYKTNDQYIMDKDVLYHVYFPTNRRRPEHMIKQLVVPTSKRKPLLVKYHDNMAGGGHQGLDRTYSALFLKYFWPKMYSHIQQHVATCDICQRTKKRHPRPPPLTPMPVVPPLHTWHMDFLKLKTTPEGYRYLLLFVDSGSRWCEAVPTKRQDAEVVAKHLYETIVTRYGVPREIVSDLGQQFRSKLVKALAELFDIKQLFTSPYHPQTNASCERMNSFIVKTIRAFCKPDQSDWPNIIPSVMMAYRSMPATRSHELSPYQVLFGKAMFVPGDVDLLPKPTIPASYQEVLHDHLNNVKICRDVARRNLLQSQEVNRCEHDRNKHAQVPTFRVGQKVLMRNEAVPVGLVPKLHPPYKGPYWITRFGPNFTYHLQDIDGKHLTVAINGRRLIPYLDRLELEQPDEGASTSNEHSDAGDTQSGPPSEAHSQLVKKLRGLLDNQDTPQCTQQPDPQDPVLAVDTTQAREQTAQPSTTGTRTPDAAEPTPGVAEAEHPSDVTQEMSQADNSGNSPSDSHKEPRIVVEVIKVSWSRGVKYYKVKLQSQTHQPWVFEENVPKELRDRFSATKTMSGKAKKRKPLKYFVNTDTN